MKVYLHDIAAVTAQCDRLLGIMRDAAEEWRKSDDDIVYAKFVLADAVRLGLAEVLDKGADPVHTVIALGQFCDAMGICKVTHGVDHIQIH